MDATLILCDYAEAVNGKLYMAGAGWTQVAAQVPASVALGVIVNVPWDQANVEHSLVLELVDQDGAVVSIGEPLSQVRQEGKFEVGRPPGTLRGTALPIVFAIRWAILPLPAGAYAFVLRVDDTEVSRVSFRAIPVEVQNAGQP